MQGSDFDEIAFVSEPGGERVFPENRRLSPDEARAYLDAPITEAEREGVLEIARWFRRRYPTPAERLAYVRRAFERWRRAQGLAARPGGVSGRGPARCHNSLE